MIYNFILVILLGFVLRFLGTVGVRRAIMKAPVDEDLRKLATFHIACGFYIVGTIFKYAGATLLFAYTIKELFLT